MRNIIAGSIALLFLISACKTNADNQDTITEEIVEITHENGGDKIETDNGNKWKVNDEMKPFITDAQNLLAGFSSESLEDYNKLGKDLQDQNNLLIQSCTMDGKSHDELHKWLHPHLELTAHLAAAQDIEHAREAINQLKHSFGTYHNYFE